jgi:hypothetical protein
MRFLLLLAVCTSLANAALSRVQQVVVTCTDATPPYTCDITVSSTSAGNLGVLLELGNPSSAHMTAISGGGSWTIASCHGTETGIYDYIGTVAYNTNLSAGVTTLSVTMGYNGNRFVFTEYSGNESGTWDLDGTCQSRSNQTATEHPTSDSITTTGTHDVIVTQIVIGSMLYGNSTVTGTGWTTPYTMFFPGPTFSVTQGAGDDAVDVAAGTYQATFTGYATRPYGSLTLAFSFTASGGGSSAPIKHRVTTGGS